ncbi:ATP-binding protein [Actinophytocola xanthii]|uniref:ATP-binding protein n=1 Tax=Actinophytocola xanthii TaxID=1912961 RepID=UPI001E456F83|nr:XRE family transcriptional regulator [Actinophytocola xanthii]
MSTFGEVLVRFRRQAGLTQEGLAEASGLSVRALRDVERGRTRAVQRRSAEALADALGLAGTDRNLFVSAAREGRRRTAESGTPPGESETAPAEYTGLPLAVPDLVGRDDELAWLSELAATGGTVAVVGHPGVGKTALALAAARRLRSAFPDGCLWVDLRGMDEQPVTVRAALDRLLRALGVPSSEDSSSESDQVVLYRSVLAGRRTLVVLDNAADELQVRPLLAATPGCLTLVTCRQVLAGLEGVRWLWLEPLAEGAALDLLATIVGEDRVTAEPRAAAELAELCGNLPLAVRIAGNRLATRPRWSLSYLVDLLGDERTRLGSLSAGDLRMRPVFEMSYRRLPPTVRLVFRRLAAVPGVDFGDELAAVATGMSGPEVRLCLGELADASLLQARPAGRFQFHDLLRLFAIERWEAEEASATREQVSDAVRGHLLSTATAAADAFAPAASRGGVFGSDAEAGEWLAREESNWIAVHRAAAGAGEHRPVVELATALVWYANHRWLGLPWVEIFELGATAASAIGDRAAEATLLNDLGWALGVCLGDRAASLRTHQQALAAAIESGERREETEAYAFIGTALEFLGRPEEALEFARQAAARAEEFDFWLVRLSVLNRLASVLHSLGRYEEALSVYHDVLAEADRQQSGASLETRRMMVAYVKEGVGDCLVALGKLREAAETFRETRRTRVELGSVGNVAVAALNEGRAWLLAKEYERARECLHYALDAYGDLAPNGRAQVLAELARLPAQ